MLLIPSLVVLLAADGATSMAPAAAARAGAVYGGVPTGEPTGEVLPLALTDAIERGLTHNLALILSQQAVHGAEGTRWEELSNLLPHLSGRFSATRQKISLEAFGFTGFAGLPTLIGPFNVYDARAAVTENLVDVSAFYKQRGEHDRVEAARHTYQDTRDLVVVVCGNLYLQALGEKSRIDAVRAQVATARALFDLASDRKRSGLVPAIDVLRAEVALKARQQQTIVAENRFARAKLMLARAIGLPAGQEIELVDRMSEAAPPAVPVAQALERAYATREDWKAAQQLLRAAEDVRRSAWWENFPTLELSADYGAIGQHTSNLHATYMLGAMVRVPLLQGGKTHGKTMKAEAELEQAKAQIEDLRSRIDFEVRTSALDLDAATRRVEVAREAVALADKEIEQARDRFGAGVANNIDVVQAQQSVSDAHESYIEALYDQSVARALMARAVGGVETAYKSFVKGD